MSFMGLVVLVILIIAAVLVVWSRVLAVLFAEKIRTAEVDHITTTDLWTLRMCRYRKAKSSGEPVLLVHGLNGNQNNFTSPAGACMVDYFSERGYDCWTVDLRGTRSSQPPAGYGRDTATVEDFVWRDLPAAIDHIRKATGHGKVHYVGHSLGGLLLYAYVQAHGADKIASGTTLGAPTQFTSIKAVLPEVLVQMALHLPWLAGEMLRCAVPVAKMSGIGLSAFPINLANVPVAMGVGDLYAILDDPAPLVHAEIFKWGDRGEITLREDSLNLSRGFDDMKFPLLALYAARDPFVSLVSAQAFFAGIRHGDKKMIVCSRENGCSEDYGHCDLAFGREGALEVFEPIMQWMEAHPGRETVRTAAAAAHAEAPKKSPEPVKAAVVSAPAAKPAVAEKAPEAVKESAKAKTAAAPKKAAVAKPAAAKTEKAPEKAVAAKKPAAEKPAAPKKAAAVKKPAVAKEPAAAKPAVAAKKKAAAEPKKAPVAKAKPAPRKPAAKG